MDLLLKTWAILRLFFAHLQFWTFPTPEESFYIMKANCYVDLGWYQRAIKNYRKAQRDSHDGRINAAIGYCYSRIGSHEEAVENYRRGSFKTRDQRTRIGLAIEEYETGNLETSERIIRELKTSSNKLDPNERAAIENLEIRVAMTKKAREEYYRDSKPK